ncbi:MAG: hypothetical protein ABS55_03765 [Lautropia sp. SCN 70-15]|nr:MAG: hypothetical protein ABS55_03765 [Lautropia sp. SCN 70-15]
MSKVLALSLLVALVSGCAIHQTVSPITAPVTREICLIENTAVRAGFVNQLRQSLGAKGYQVRMLPETAAINACTTTATYTATWRWDLALYMSYAEIKVYSNARPVGEALYDSTGGGGNMGKFIDANEKIRELVDQLFPAGAGA